MEFKTCVKCNTSKQLDEFYYNKRRKKRTSSCKKCNHKKSHEYQKSGYRDKPKYVFYQRAYELNRRNRECIPVKELSTYLNEIWISQNEMCYYTGLKMELTGYLKTPYAMTVDRIDSSKGYVKGNIVLCLSIINRIKQDLSIDELKNWIKMIK